jgi:hypothetical protein
VKHYFTIHNKNSKKLYLNEKNTTQQYCLYKYEMQNSLNSNKPTTAGKTSTSAFIRKPEAADCSLKEHLMMGIMVPETCWAASMWLSNKFYDWLLHLVGFFIWIIWIIPYICYESLSIKSEKFNCNLYPWSISSLSFHTVCTTESIRLKWNWGL